MGAYVQVATIDGIAFAGGIVPIGMAFNRIVWDGKATFPQADGVVLEPDTGQEIWLPPPLPDPGPISDHAVALLKALASKLGITAKDIDDAAAAVPRDAQDAVDQP